MPEELPEEEEAEPAARGERAAAAARSAARPEERHGRRSLADGSGRGTSGSDSGGAGIAGGAGGGAGLLLMPAMTGGGALTLAPSGLRAFIAVRARLRPIIYHARQRGRRRRLRKRKRSERTKRPLFISKTRAGFRCRANAQALESKPCATLSEKRSGTSSETTHFKFPFVPPISPLKHV